MASFLNVIDQRRLIGPGGSTVSGDIYFYYSGTSVLAPVYTDSSLLVPSVNPVPVGAGEIVPNLYLDDSIIYRRVIIYSDGTQDENDPIGPVFEEGDIGIPVGSILDYAGAAAPSGFLFCFGQEIVRATYPELFDAIGVTYGAGNGTTTFNLPDYRGRVAAGKDNMGGVAANRLTSPVTGSTLGAVGGEQAHTLVTGEVPSHNHTVTDPGHTHSTTLRATGVGGSDDAATAKWNVRTSTDYGNLSPATSSSTTGISLAASGGGGSHNNTQPTIIFNKIIKVTPLTFVSFIGLDFTGKASAAAIGITASAADMGTYAGSTISDNESTKQNIQELETAVETKANATAVGVTSSATSMGTFTGTTIADNVSAKAGMQSLETAVELRQTTAALIASSGSSLVSTIAAGTGAVSRTIQSVLRERGVSVTDFGAVGDGVTDDLAAFNAALASGARVIYVPSVSTFYRLSGPWNVTRSCRIYGDGASPYVGAPPGTRGAGSWVKFDHTGEGIKFYGTAGQELSGGIIEGIGTIRNQPASTVGWVPTSNDFDLVFLSGDWYADKIVGWNPTNFIKHDFAGYGRLEIGTVHANPFLTGIQIDRCYDVFRANNIHFWPFSGIDANVTTYKLAHLVGLRMGKCDGAFINNYFVIAPNIGVHLIDTGNGFTTHAMFDNAYIDLYGEYAIVVDSDGGSFEFSRLLGQGAILADGHPSGADYGVVITGDNFHGKIGQFQLNRVNQYSALITGASSRLDIAQPTVEDWNRSAGSYPAFDVLGAGSTMFITEQVKTSGGSGGPLIGTSANISSKEWRDTTPTPVSSGGTITTASSSVSHNHNGSIVNIRATVTITNNGSGSASVQLAMPIACRSGKTYVIHGSDRGLSGKSIQGVISGSTMNIYNYDNSYPGGTGAVFYIDGFYEADPM